MSAFSESRERWGLWRTLAAGVYHRVGKVLGLHVLLINARPLAPDSDVSTLPDGHAVRCLAASDVATIAADPALEMDASFLEQAMQQGDVCIGYFDDGHLVSYFWCGFKRVPAEAGLSWL